MPATARSRSASNPKVDWFFAKETQWKEAFALLRKTALEFDVEEVLKWGHPCYSTGGKNVFLMHGFNEYCALLFINGVLLKDREGLLIQQTKNSQTARQMRFESVAEIKKLLPAIRANIEEALDNEKAGKKPELKTTAEYDVPEEFSKALRNVQGLRKAFNALTPGRQRGYLLYFSAPKQSKTRESRIEKYTEAIFAGKGVND